MATKRKTKKSAEKPASHDTPFGCFARNIAMVCGRPITFILAVALVVIWAVTGPLFDFSETWQLVINTGTTIITFLMVFVIQNTQNKDTEAMQIKLDELIRASRGANNAIMGLEDFSEKELNIIRARYDKLAEDARQHLRKGTIDEEKPAVRENFNLS